MILRNVQSNDEIQRLYSFSMTEEIEFLCFFKGFAQPLRLTEVCYVCFVVTYHTFHNYKEYSTNISLIFRLLGCELFSVKLLFYHVSDYQKLRPHKLLRFSKCCMQLYGISSCEQT